MKFVSPTSASPGPADFLDLDQLLSDTRWAPLADLLPEGILLVDSRGFVRFINSAAESIAELPRLEVVNRSLQHFVKQSAVECGALLEAFSTGSKTSQIVSTSALQPCVLSTRCVRTSAGEVACFLVTLRGAEQLNRLLSDTATPGRSTAAGSAITDDLDSMILSEQTRPLVELGLRAMSQGSRILLLGESGVGKTEFARYLQRRFGNAARPFVHVNCGSIPESLFESEMFGYERGSFTGALSKGKKGLVESADGGVLFLDEIGEIPLPSQAKMLQFLEDSAISRVGSTHSRRLNLQVIAATNRNLRELVATGAFRRDLYYRLSVVTLTLPPLRSSSQIVEQLIERFTSSVNRRRQAALQWSEGAYRRLSAYSFPGNIRELRNIVEHLSAVCERTISEKDVERALSDRSGLSDRPPDFPDQEDSDGEALTSLRDAVRKFESRVVKDAIERCGSKRKAAEMLGVDIATIVRKSRA